MVERQYDLPAEASVHFESVLVDLVSGGHAYHIAVGLASDEMVDEVTNPLPKS